MLELSNVLFFAGTKEEVFICGNGGSAANADHLANDFIYAIARSTGAGWIKCHFVLIQLF